MEIWKTSHENKFVGFFGGGGEGRTRTGLSGRF